MSEYMRRVGSWSVLGTSDGKPVTVQSVPGALSHERRGRLFEEGHDAFRHGASALCVCVCVCGSASAYAHLGGPPANKNQKVLQSRPVTVTRTHLVQIDWPCGRVLLHIEHSK